MGHRVLSRHVVFRRLGLSLAACLAPLIVWSGLAVPAAVANVTPPPTPNIVLILTDDQGDDMFGPMPLVRSEILDRGVTFRNGVSPTPLCCPARAALLTGTYAHTNGVWTNQPRLGGWATFADREGQTLATALDAAGYQTGFFGKYLNGWSKPAESVVPPGWDSFAAMRGSAGGAGAYYNYQLRGTGPEETFGSAASDYSTDVLAEKSSSFISSTDPADPFFVVYAPYGPHGPSTPAPRHDGTLTRSELQPSVNEADMSDKPAFMAQLPLLPNRKLRRMIRDQKESLRSVDDGVQQLVEAVGPDRVANTLFVFLSDNALMNGDHRLLGKYVPYKGATAIPIAMRWDNVITPGQIEQRVFTLQDVATTIIEAAGATLPTEGVSYLSGKRKGTVVEGVQASTTGIIRPAYCGWRTKRYLYVRYSDGAGEELYHYAVDPHELDNKATDPAYAAKRSQFRATARPACTPGPPGFLWASGR